MKKSTKSVLRVLISIVYILWGIFSPISVIQAILALNLSAILSAAVGVMMLLAGIFGLLKIKARLCNVFGVVLFILSVVTFIFALPVISVHSIITAILAWLFILCV